MNRAVEIWLHAFLTSVLEGCEWLFVCQGHSIRTLRKSVSGNHRIRGCVAPKLISALSRILSIYAVKLREDPSYSKGIALMIISANKPMIFMATCWTDAVQIKHWLDYLSSPGPTNRVTRTISHLSEVWMYWYQAFGPWSLHYEWFYLNTSLRETSWPVSVVETNWVLPLYFVKPLR